VTRLRRTLAAERGIALPIALSVLFIVAGLAAVAARAAINANHSSYRDSNVKRAIQAANAGVKAAVYQLNLMQPLPSECVLRATSGGTLSVAKATTTWCPSQTEDLGGNASYTFLVSQSTPLAYNSNGQVITERSIVSTGTVNGFPRRVLVRVTAPGGDPLFPKNYAAVSMNSITWGNTVTVNGYLGSNGNITLQQSAKVRPA
jgi:Tfp pilus assembly protein PilX